MRLTLVYVYDYYYYYTLKALVSFYSYKALTVGEVNLARGSLLPLLYECIRAFCFCFFFSEKCNKPFF